MGDRACFQKGGLRRLRSAGDKRRKSKSIGLTESSPCRRRARTYFNSLKRAESTVRFPTQLNVSRGLPARQPYVANRSVTVAKALGQPVASRPSGSWDSSWFHSTHSEFAESSRYNAGTARDTCHALPFPAEMPSLFRGTRSWNCEPLRAGFLSKGLKLTGLLQTSVWFPR